MRGLNITVFARRTTLVVVTAAIAMMATDRAAEAVVRGKPVHGLALYGEPKYGPDFKNFEYVNPDAPKGGTFVKTNEAALTFDTFNPYTIKGVAVHGLELLLFDTLMVQSQDEPDSVYGLISKTVEVAPDNSWVQFVLRPEAKFTDGSAITAEDVVFSFKTVITKAVPRYRGMYAEVSNAEAVKPDTVRFTFATTNNAKLPMQIGEYLPILSKAYWKDRDFTATTLDIPVTSGPYVIESFETGKYILYRRNEKYWARDLPVNRGQYNFDHVRFDYYRDDDVEFEAFRTGAYDFKRETRARRWANEYNFQAVIDGRVAKINLKDIQPVSSQPLSLNLRRAVFQDRRVREALNYAFDFESLNKNLFYSQYVRSRSYWQGSPLEATGTPSAAELKLLEPFRDRLPPEVFTGAFTQPTTMGDGDLRQNLLKARDLLKDAGWELRDGKLTHAATGQPFAFEILLNQQSSERVFLPFTQNLKRLGIEATLRLVDTSQYVNRLNAFDYDATFVVLPHNDLTPGAEQAENWGSQAADTPASNNISGVKDPVVDALIAKIGAAESYDDILTATHALDRVLTWNFYQLMTYTSPTERYAYWTKLKTPEVMPALGLGGMGEFSTGLGESVIALWWMDPAAANFTAEATSPEARATRADNISPPRSGGRIWAIVALVSAGGLVVVFIMRRRNT